ncbi:MAG TPA: hypothetical protein VGY56_21045 [Verrucomicrobiae bacterium]|nr:hypothetical protein [Verrucomicrobiae bacterium]
MKRRFILYRRKRGGMFYIEDTETRKQESTGTRNRAEATSLLNARNESVRQPHLNLQIAKAYLAGTDSGVATWTWQDALNAIIDTNSGSTQYRWQTAAKDKAFDLIRNLVILETQGDQLLACPKAGTVSTNVHLRKLHNFSIFMNWLLWPLIPKRLWPNPERGGQGHQGRRPGGPRRLRRVPKILDPGFSFVFRQDKKFYPAWLHGSDSPAGDATLKETLFERYQHPP